MAVPAGYRKATDEEKRNYMSAPRGYRKATPQEKAQREYDQSSILSKLGTGAKQSFTELGHGVADLLDTASSGHSGQRGMPENIRNAGPLVTDADKARLATTQGVEGGWKTAGQVGGEIAQVLAPGGAFGKVAMRGLPMALKASRGAKYGTALAGDVLATGALEQVKGKDGLQAAGTTAGVGLALPGALKALGKVAAPMREGAKEMLEAGVRLTPGQARGGIVGGAEKAMSYIPGLAGGVRTLREKAMQDWNEYIRLGNSGQTLPKGFNPQSSMKVWRSALDEMYETAFKGEIKLTGNPAVAWSEILDGAKSQLPPKEYKKIFRALSGFADPIATAKGAMSGRAAQALDRGLSKLATRAAKRGDGVQANIYDQAREAFRKTMPEGRANMIADTNAEYAKYATVRDATSKASPQKRKPPGMITPGELSTSAVKGNKTAASEGRAVMQKEAEQAMDLLGPNMPSASGYLGLSASLSPAVHAVALASNPALGAAGLAARGGLVNSVVRDAMTGRVGSGGQQLLDIGQRAIAAGQGTSDEDRMRQIAAALRSQR